MKPKFRRLGKPSPAMIVSIIALVFAIGGGAAIAGIPKSGLKLGMFKQDSRDRLAGTGVIQYAAQAHTTGDATSGEIKQFDVKCELSKKATSGGYKWTDQTPPPAEAVEFLDAYPTGGGFVVRIRITHDTDADNKALTVYSNCVKSRAQRGTPPT